MNHLSRKTTNFFLHLLLFVLPLSDVMAETPTGIKAVLFYPPFCVTCPAIIEDYLIPMSMTHVESLELYPVDITEPPGSEIYKEVLKHFATEVDSWEIPSILVGQQLLRGEMAIKEGLPKLIEASPAEAANWPNVAGLQQMITGDNNSVTPDEKTGKDTIATGMAWTVMTFMLVSLVFAAWRLITNGNKLLIAPRIDSWSLPLFAILGLGIGIYLTSVAFTHSEAMCGPVGDCLSVQTSPYSKLFGIPMALWGVGYYLGILALWLMQRILSGSLRLRLTIGLLAFGIFGVLFSVYLTGLELFVIHAVCLWCLASAVLTLMIMLLVIRKLTATHMAIS